MKVCICILAKDRADLLEQSLISLSNQTYKNIEIIVSDNYSVTDATKNVVDKFPHVRYEKPPEPLEVYDHYNFVKNELGSGDILGVFADDDIYEPNFIEESVRLFIDNSKVYMTHTGFDFWYFETNKLKRVITNLKTYGSSIHYLERFSKQTPTINSPTLLIKTDIYKKFDYKPHFILADFELWLRIIVNTDGYVGYVDKALMRYRKHKRAMTVSDDRFSNRVLMANEYCNFFWDLVKHSKNSENLNENLSKLFKSKVLNTFQYQKILNSNYRKEFITNVKNNNFVSVTFIDVAKDVSKKLGYKLRNNKTN